MSVAAAWPASSITHHPRCPLATSHAVPVAPPGPTVVKVGGGLAGVPGALARVGQVVAQAAQRFPLVVIPGGGPFADQVRRFSQIHPLSDSAAHWMAILAMDQYAFALGDVIPGARVVDDQRGIQGALAGGAVPVLAPSRWLRAADELPHRWEVTSDSLAACLATLLGARRLVLLKPVAGGMELTDPWFERALAAGMRCDILAADQVDRLLLD